MRRPTLDFEEAFADWLPRADPAQLQVVRERIDLALVLKLDANKERAAEVKNEKRAVKAALKALGIKTRSDAGTKRKPRTKRKPKPSADQVTE